MKSCRSVLLLAGAFALAACQTTYEGNEDSPYYVVPPGTPLLLNQPLTIPPEQVSVWLQDGRVIDANDARMYYPHCKFEVRERMPTAQTVTPDEFIVTRVTRSLMHSVRAPDPSERMVARIGVGFGFGAGINMGTNGPSVQTFATRMNLGSDRQPNVMRLTCGHWDYPYDGRHLTISEIRNALGGVFDLRLAQPGRG